MLWTKDYHTKLKCLLLSSILYKNICVSLLSTNYIIFIPPPLFPVILVFEMRLIYIVSRIHSRTPTHTPQCTHTCMYFHTHVHVIMWIPEMIACFSKLLTELHYKCSLKSPFRFLCVASAFKGLNSYTLFLLFPDRE